MRARALPALLAVIACSAGALAGATAPTVAAEESSDDYPGLTPVEGGDGVSEAPTITAGSYVDTFPEDPDEVRVYLVDRTDRDSVLHYGITLLDGATGSVRAPALLPEGPDGDPLPCGNVVRDAETQSTQMPLSTYGGIASYAVPRCAEADTLAIGVAPGDGSPPPPGTPYRLSVWEAPLPANLDDLGTPTPLGSTPFASVAPDEVDRQVAAGASLPEATVLPEDGAYHVDLPLGTVSWFAMDVPDGEALAAELLAHDLERRNQGATIEMRPVSPGGGFANPDSITDGSALFEVESAQVATLGLEPVVLQTQTNGVGPQGYVLAEDPALARTGNDVLASTAGSYYLAVHTQNLTGEDGATIPVTLNAATVDVDAYLTSGPRWAGDEPTPLPGPSASDSGAEPEPFDGAAYEADRVEAQEAAEAAEARELEEAGEDRQLPWWFWVVGATVLLGSILLAAVLSRRRRRRVPGRGDTRPRPGAGPPGPHPGAGPPGPHPGGFGPGGPRPGGGVRPGPGGPPTPPTRIRPGRQPGGPGGPGTPGQR